MLVRITRSPCFLGGVLTTEGDIKSLFPVSYIMFSHSIYLSISASGIVFVCHFHRYLSCRTKFQKPIVPGRGGHRPPAVNRLSPAQLQRISAATKKFNDEMFHIKQERIELEQDLINHEQNHIHLGHDFNFLNQRKQGLIDIQAYIDFAQ